MADIIIGFINPKNTFRGPNLYGRRIWQPVADSAQWDDRPAALGFFTAFPGLTHIQMKLIRQQLKTESSNVILSQNMS